jgi:hypothetical protein
MNRLTLFSFQLFLVAVTTLTAVAQGPFTEAPADFDDKTNAFVSQSDFDKAKAAFEEVETGAISQINELRAGHNRQIVVSGALVTIFRDAPGGSIIHDRSIPTNNTLTPPVKGAKLQERVPPLLTASVVSGPPP